MIRKGIASTLGRARFNVRSSRNIQRLAVEYFTRKKEKIFFSSPFAGMFNSTKILLQSGNAAFHQPEQLEIDEILTSSTASGGHQAEGSFDGPSSLDDAEQTIVLDTFVKPRLLNCVNRHVDLVSQATGQKIATSKSLVFETHPIEEDGKKLIRAVCKFQVMAPGNPEPLSISGEGFASSQSDAEVAAAMHSERLLDACGVAVFSLAATQSRHAEAAAKAGRLAPYPPKHALYEEQMAKIRSANERPRPVYYTSTSPAPAAGNAPPASTANTAKRPHLHNPNNYADALAPVEGTHMRPIPSTPDGDWRVGGVFFHPRSGSDPRLDESEGGKYWLVSLGPPPMSSPPEGLCSPHLLCPDSMKRIKQYFTDHEECWEDEKKVEVFVARPQFQTKLMPGMHVVTVPLPGLHSSVVNGEPAPRQVLAVGVAKDPKIAEALCAMHAELLVDHYGGRLYVFDDAMQDKHAELCWESGRFAVSAQPENDPPRILDKRDNEPPKPLREWISRRGVPFFRVAPMPETEATYPIHQNIVYMRGSNILECNEDSASDEHIELIRDFNRRQGMAKWESHFLHVEFMSQWATSVQLQLPEKTYGVRGGWAVTQKPMESGRRLAALHAIETLCWLGIPLHEKIEDQLGFEEERKQRGLCVHPRDKNGQIIKPPPHIRSPPAFRGYGGTLLPPYKDLKYAMYLDTTQFDVALCVGEHISVLRTFVEVYSKKLFASSNVTVLGKAADSTSFRRRFENFNVYCGQGLFRGVFQNHAVSYTVWLEIPLAGPKWSPQNTGDVQSTIAMGRSNKRNVSERMCLLHAFRMIAAYGRAEVVMMDDPTFFVLKSQLDVQYDATGPAILPARPMYQSPTSSTTPLPPLPLPLVDKDLAKRIGLPRRQPQRPPPKHYVPPEKEV